MNVSGMKIVAITVNTFITSFMRLLTLDMYKSVRPELNWYWGYPVALVVMVGIAGLLVLYFKRKGWIGGGMES